MSRNSKESTASCIALKPYCPRCDEGSLYKTFLTLYECCPVCALPFRQEGNNGLVVFGLFLIMTMTLMLAGLIEIMFAPPLWLHMALWIPFIIGNSLLGIRMTKTTLVILRYRFEEESRSEE